MNSAPVDRPWFTICRMPPLIPLIVPTNMPSTTNPRWATDEYAIEPFQVLLHRRDQRSVDDPDDRKRDDERDELARRIREQRDRRSG